MPLLHIAAPGSSPPAVGFETPLAMLSECHRRVEDQCATLQRLLPHLARQGSDADAAAAAAAVLRYFEQAAPQHHADEEDDLFPALRPLAQGDDAAPLRTLLDGLLAEHRRLEQAWAALRPALQAVAARRPATLDAAAVQAFTQGYAAHIACEDGQLLPLAARLLPEAEQARIGRRMRQRRGAPD